MNQWPECIDIYNGASFVQGDSSLFKYSPYGHVWPHPRVLNFYIVIYREMLKKSSSQEPLGQFEPNFAETMP